MRRHGSLSRLMLDLCPHMLFLIAADGTVLYANRPACACLGVKRAAVREMNTSDIFLHSPVYGDDSLVTHVRAAGGKLVPVRLQMQPVPLGSTRTMAVLARDAKTETSTEKTIRLQNCLLDAVRDAVVIYDRQGRITFWNRPAATLYGWSEDDALGKSFADLVPMAPRKTDAPGTVRPAMADAPWRGECVVTDRDGRSVPVYVLDLPLPGGGENVECTATISYDLSESRKTEEALRRSEERFQQAQKMEAIGQLTGSIMHDFNNLLAVITGHCSLALEEAVRDSSLYESLQGIASAAHKASSLTQQLLNYSRKQVPHFRLLDLSVLVGEIKGMLGSVLGNAIEVTAHLAAKPCHTMVDAVGMEQVIMNLAVNARDAMPGGGKLTFTTGRVFIGNPSPRADATIPPGDYVALDVADTGEGMDAVTLSHAFEPFFTTKEQGKGTGLGLCSVQRIVMQHRGYITCHSVRGQGTRFTIYLPWLPPEKLESGQ